MSRHWSLAQALHEISTHRPRHRAARVLRFIYRHPTAHRSIIRALQKAERRRIRRQPANAIAFTTFHPKGGDPSQWPEDLRIREWPTAAAGAPA